MSDRLRELNSLRIQVSKQSRRTHRTAIADEIKASPRPPTRRRAWSKRVVGVVVALAVSLPATAFASVGAVPGDLLYPIKEAIEPLWALVDPEVVPRHRIDELEVLVDIDAEQVVVDRQIDRARDALTDLEAPDLDRRLDRILDTLPDRPTDQAPTDGDRSSISPEETRDSPTTTQPASDETDVPSDTRASRDSATTTTVPTDSDGPAQTDRPPDDR